jgi:hypothetical protein
MSRVPKELTLADLNQADMRLIKRRAELELAKLNRAEKRRLSIVRAMRRYREKKKAETLAARQQEQVQELEQKTKVSG